MLYDVYQHPTKGAWAVNVDGKVVRTAELANGKLLQAEIPPHKFAGEVGKHVRMGYVKVVRSKYLHITQDGLGHPIGAFTERHPELLVDDGVSLFTTVADSDDVNELADVWETTLGETDVPSDQADKWLQSVRSASQYIAASKKHPAFGLIVADWAIKHGRVVMSDQQGIPLKVPSNAPYEWEQWLSSSPASRETVRVALAQLGWSLRDVLIRTSVVKPETNEDAQTWFADASSIAF